RTCRCRCRRRCRRDRSRIVRNRARRDRRREKSRTQAKLRSEKTWRDGLPTTFYVLYPRAEFTRQKTRRPAQRQLSYSVRIRRLSRFLLVLLINHWSRLPEPYGPAISAASSRRVVLEWAA